MLLRKSIHPILRSPNPRCLHTKNSRHTRLHRCRRAALDDNQNPETPSEKSNEPWRGNLSFTEVKEKYLRPTYLPASFVLGTLTFGIKTAADNFVFQQDPLGFIGCAAVSGLIITAIAWVLFDFTDDPPSGGNFSSPR